jgi:hypothetical protein
MLLNMWQVTHIIYVYMFLYNILINTSKNSIIAYTTLLTLNSQLNSYKRNLYARLLLNEICNFYNNLSWNVTVNKLIN